ncbi:MAG TPA: hypothetical protein ENN22_00905 [bacterium]|nr:hypothetical protein [bacterium]
MLEEEINTQSSGASLAGTLCCQQRMAICYLDVLTQVEGAATEKVFILSFQVISNQQIILV